MANKTLFAAPVSQRHGPINDTGGKAYSFESKHALAQLACTSTLADGFYKSASAQLTEVLSLTEKVSPKFLAQTAVFAREKGFMKDMPALLAVVLSKKDPELLKKVFNRVIDNGRMVRTFVQVVRSGKAGRKSLGSSPRNLLRDWICSRTPEQMLFASIGNDPSLVDVFKLCHMKPKDAKQDALIKYLMDKEYDANLLPEVIKQYEAFKKGETSEIPKVPFQMLTSLDIGTPGWTAIAKNAKWQFIRMNLNNFQKYGVFKDPDMVTLLATKLRDPEEVRNSRIFPYQLMMAFRAISADMPHQIREALQDAMETATENVPEIDGNIFIFPDISGSMQSNPVTGDRGSATTQVMSLDVAALIAASFVRKNRNAAVMPFSDDVVAFQFNPRDSVMTNAEKLRKLPSGGTNCSAPLRRLNQKSLHGDLIIYASDNESWVDSNHSRRGATETMVEWKKFKARNPKAKMVCIDLAVGTTTQAAENGDILNIGGFSDMVFDTIADFFRDGRIKKAAENVPVNFVAQIEAVDLDAKPVEERFE